MFIVLVYIYYTNCLYEKTRHKKIGNVRFPFIIAHTVYRFPNILYWSYAHKSSTKKQIMKKMPMYIASFYNLIGMLGIDIKEWFLLA